jgi:hypothetical protein
MAAAASAALFAARIGRIVQTIAQHPDAQAFGHCALSAARSALARHVARGRG